MCSHPISTLTPPQTEALSLLNTDPAPPQPGTPTCRAQDPSAPAFGSGITQNLPPCVWLVSCSTGSSRGPSCLRLNPPQHGDVHPFVQPRPLRLSHIPSRACPIHLPPVPLPRVVREELCGLQPWAARCPFLVLSGALSSLSSKHRGPGAVLGRSPGAHTRGCIQSVVVSVARP